jgi:hypothetical protein
MVHDALAVAFPVLRLHATCGNATYHRMEVVPPRAVVVLQQAALFQMGATDPPRDKC